MSYAPPPTYHEHITYLRGKITRLESRRDFAMAQYKRDRPVSPEARQRAWGIWNDANNELEHRDRDLAYWTAKVAADPSRRHQRIPSPIRGPRPAPPSPAPHFSEPREPGADDGDELAF